MKLFYLTLSTAFVLFLAVACASNQKENEPIIAQTPQTQSEEMAQTSNSEMGSEEPTQTPATTVTTQPTVTATATGTNTPIPATETPLPTSTPEPTLTPTPKPITHANIGWPGYDTEARDPFPDEMRIKSEILENQKGTWLEGITEEDIKIVWYTTDDGTVYWLPYFTINITQANNDLYLFMFPLTTDPNGDLSLLPINTKQLSVSALERLGYIDNITDIQLAWNEKYDKPMIGVEKNGAYLWYPDELLYVLVSYDEDLSAFGFPPKPDPASDFVLAMNIEDAYLFKYDETATASAGISKPNAGPVYELNNNQWRPMNHSEFLGGGSPQIAYIAYDADGDGHLYIEELTSTQTGFEMRPNIHTPLAPAAIVYDAALSNISSFDYYYSLASPVWSPDGRHVAFLAEESETPYLAVYDVDNQTWQSLVQLPRNPELFFSPVWSPDGDWLVYGYRFSGENFGRLITVSYPDGVVYEVDRGWQPQWVKNENGLRLNYEKYSGELFMADPDGSNIEQLNYSIPPESIDNPEDGFALIQRYVPEQDAFLVYRSNQEDEIDKLVYVPLDGSEEILLAELPTEKGICSYSDFLFSPDDIWLMTYKSCIKDGASTFQGFYLLNLQTQRGENLNWEANIYNDNVYNIEGWTPDSRGIIDYNWFGVRVFDAETGERAYYSLVFPLRAARSIWGNSGILNWPDEP